MSLDITLKAPPRLIAETAYETNITHNLRQMALATGVYYHCWRPEEIGIDKAKQLIEPLKNAISLLVAYPEKFKEFDESNGWGTYEQFVPWLRRLLQACEAFPEATIEASR